jgi:glycosyltransferase involved in cell wall biosynthesis
MDLVVVSLEKWDSVWRRNQHLVAGLLGRDPELRVLFVEPAADPLHELRRRRRPRRGSGLRRGPDLTGVAGDRLWRYQPTKLLPRRLDRQVDARLARSVVRATARVGLADPVLWINDPDGAALLELTGWPALYDVTDDWTLADRAESERVRLVQDEETLLGRCREVVVCSPELARTKGALRAVTLIPNAVDTMAYRMPMPRPADLPPEACAVYVGTVHRDRIDIGLCEATAKAIRGQGRLVLVGPAPLDSADLRRLERAGVLLLGPRPHALVPAYLQHADVLIVPHVVSEFTESLDPIKLYEYMAVARPVISTPVAGFRDVSSGLVEVMEPHSFAAAVADALAQSPAPAGSAQEEVPDWAVRVEAFREVLSRVPPSSAVAT